MYATVARWPVASGRGNVARSGAGSKTGKLSYDSTESSPLELPEQPFRRPRAGATLGHRLRREATGAPAGAGGRALTTGMRLLRPSSSGGRAVRAASSRFSDAMNS